MARVSTPARASIGAVAGLLFLGPIGRPSIARAQDFRTPSEREIRPSRTPVELLAPPGPPEPPPIPEPPSAPFGAPGQVVLSGAATSVAASSSTYESGAEFRSVALSTGFDVFVAPHVSLGFDLEASAYKTRAFDGARQLTERRGHAFAGGVRVGVDVPLSERWSWYPRLTLGLRSASSEQDIVLGPTAVEADRGVWTALTLPLVAHLRAHLFIGVGPYLRYSFGTAEGTEPLSSFGATLGLSVNVGGWWGGTPAPVPVDAGEPPATRTPKFGENRQAVFSGSASLYSTTYAAPHNSGSALSLAPAFDYFVAAHVAIGVAVAVERRSSSYVDVASGPTETTSFDAAFAMRLGVDIPLGEGLSIFPRTGFGTGGGVHKASGSAAASTNKFWVFVEAPLLVHVAPHFFIGAGPFLRKELASDVQYDGSALTTTNRSASYGVTTVLGGWL